MRENTNKIFNIKPTVLTIISTFECTAACPNCCFECSPKRKESITSDQAIQHIKYVKEYIPSVRLVVITG